MKEEIFDAIIVGQGLAGTVLAWQFILKNKRILIIDNNHTNCASNAAIGVFNPLIIKKLNKSWRAMELIEYSKAFFKMAEKQLLCDIISEIPIHRIFAHEDEKRIWQEKSALKAWKNFIGNSEISVNSKNYETGVIKNTGWVNIPKFLMSSNELFVSKKIILNTDFDHSKLKISVDLFSYDGHKGKKIIFAEGYSVGRNPFFSDLPLNPAKGEILVIKDPELNLKEILKTSFFIAPIGDHQYKIGATFQWDDLNENVSEKAKLQLLEKIKPFTSKKLEVLQQIAGVRPAVVDRRPLIGKHKTHQGMCVFNGMGTRGIMLAPYFSEQLYSHIYDGASLSEEVDISRFN